MLINLLKSIFRDGEESGKLVWNPYPGPDHQPVLRKLKNIAPGCDNLPAWLFKKNWLMLLLNF